jgi:hypothetical protein
LRIESALFRALADLHRKRAELELRVGGSLPASNPVVDSAPPRHRYNNSGDGA